MAEADQEVPRLSAPTELIGLAGLRLGPRICRAALSKTEQCDCSGVTPHERHLLQQLEATYHMLDKWFRRTVTSVEEPQPGSELFEDDQVFRYSPISEISRISLAGGVEHLRMIRVVIDARQLFPTTQRIAGHVA
jgi:hypothetical protein